MTKLPRRLRDEFARRHMPSPRLRATIRSLGLSAGTRVLVHLSPESLWRGQERRDDSDHWAERLPQTEAESNDLNGSRFPLRTAGTKAAAADRRGLDAGDFSPDENAGLAAWRSPRILAGVESRVTCATIFSFLAEAKEGARVHGPASTHSKNGSARRPPLTDS
jgi:hypothetical protein